MAIFTIPHGLIALRSGTKNLEHSPSSVASIRRNDVAGEDTTSAPRGAAPGTNYPASPLIGPAPNPGLSGKGAGWAPGHPFGPLAMSLLHTAPWDLTNAAQRVKYTVVEIV
jgi:hypothetical protein